MWSSFTAEMLKFRKRTATWVLLLVLFLSVVLGGYVSVYGFLLGPNDPTGATADTRTVGDLNPEVFAALLPEKMPVNTLLAVSRFGGSVVALVFGSLAFGSEYNWGTLKTVLSRKPGKFGAFTGKVLAMLVYFALFSALALSAGAACSYAIASIAEMPTSMEEVTIRWPSTWNIVKAFGAGWLIFVVYGTLGAFLATVFRSSSVSIGIGLGYAILVETVVGSLPSSGDDLQPIYASLLGKNANDLARSFGELPEYFFATTPGEMVQPEQAAITLGGYTLVMALVSLLVFLRRDVT